LSHDGIMPTLTQAQYVGYSLASLIMVAAGAGVACWLNDTGTVKNAFVLGMSLPSLFQVGGLQSNTTNQAMLSPGRGFEFIASAMAQGPDAATATAHASVPLPDGSVVDRKLEVSSPNSSVSDNLAVKFLDKDSNPLATIPAKRGFTAIPVPANAVAVQFQKGDSLSDAQPLGSSGASVKSAEVNISEDTRSAFMQAIGLARTSRVEIKATVSDADKLAPGKRGWCYLGERGTDSWRTRYVDFPGQGIPAVGDSVTVNFPLNVRPSPAAGSLIGIAHAGQQLRIEQIQQKNNQYWADATVLQ
jgi:hypothetical protein